MHALDWRPWPQFSSTRLPAARATTTKIIIYPKPLVSGTLCKRCAGSMTAPICGGIHHRDEYFVHTGTSSCRELQEFSPVPHPRCMCLDFPIFPHSWYSNNHSYPDCSAINHWPEEEILRIFLLSSAALWVLTTWQDYWFPYSMRFGVPLSPRSLSRLFLGARAGCLIPHSKGQPSSQGFVTWVAEIA